MKQTFEKGTMCYRCGADRKEARRLKRMACSAWGSHYEKHLWNDKPVTCEVETVNLTT